MTDNRKYNQTDLEIKRREVYGSLPKEEKESYGELERLSAEDANSLLIKSFRNFNPVANPKQQEHQYRITDTNNEEQENQIDIGKKPKKEFAVDGKIVKMALDYEYSQIKFGPPSEENTEHIKIEFYSPSKNKENWYQVDFLYEMFQNHVYKEIEDNIQEKISLKKQKSIRNNLKMVN